MSISRNGVSRRNVLAGLTGAGAYIAAGTQTLGGRALAQTAAATDIITRTIPRSDIAVPAIGLGTFLTFDLVPGRPRTALRDVMQTFWEGGGRVIDTSPLYGTAEINVGDFASALGITDQIFLMNKIWSTGEYLADASHAEASLRESRARLWREHIDVMQVHSLTNVDVISAMLQGWKKQGLIKFVGITHHENGYHDLLADWIDKGGIDFVQVNYSIFNRNAENRVLRAAADKGVAVLVNMPFEKARLFKVVEGKPLPDFAQEFGVANWAQFFLKWVIANPDVTVVLPATSSPAHMRENIGALRGPLPDSKMRARMVRHMEDLPGFATIAAMPWYPGKVYDGIIRQAQIKARAGG